MTHASEGDSTGTGEIRHGAQHVVRGVQLQPQGWPRHAPLGGQQLRSCNSNAVSSVHGVHQVVRFVKDDNAAVEHNTQRVSAAKGSGVRPHIHKGCTIACDPCMFKCRPSNVQPQSFVCSNAEYCMFKMQSFACSNAELPMFKRRVSHVQTYEKQVCGGIWTQPCTRAPRTQVPSTKAPGTQVSKPQFPGAQVPGQCGTLCSKSATHSGHHRSRQNNRAMAMKAAGATVELLATTAAEGRGRNSASVGSFLAAHQSCKVVCGGSTPPQKKEESSSSSAYQSCKVVCGGSTPPQKKEESPSSSAYQSCKVVCGGSTPPQKKEEEGTRLSIGSGRTSSSAYPRHQPIPPAAWLCSSGLSTPETDGVDKPELSRLRISGIGQFKVCYSI
eukprot:362070-Chlamydomonas_euryale.AAC.12